MNKGLDNFDIVYYINLEHRKDRYEHITKELKNKLTDDNEDILISFICSFLEYVVEITNDLEIKFNILFKIYNMLDQIKVFRQIWIYHPQEVKNDFSKVDITKKILDSIESTYESEKLKIDEIQPQIKLLNIKKNDILNELCIEKEK